MLCNTNCRPVDEAKPLRKCLKEGWVSEYPTSSDTKAGIAATADTQGGGNRRVPLLPSSFVAFLSLRQVRVERKVE